MHNFLSIYTENSIKAIVLGISWLVVLYCRFNLLRHIYRLRGTKANIIIIALDTQHFLVQASTLLIYTVLILTHLLRTKFIFSHITIWGDMVWCRNDDTCKCNNVPSVSESNEAFKPYQQTFISMQFITACPYICLTACYSWYYATKLLCCLWCIHLICF